MLKIVIIMKTYNFLILDLITLIESTQKLLGGNILPNNLSF